jgi:hypothetical protein
MTAAKVASAIPIEALARAKREVRAGRAKSLGAFVSEAIDERLRRDELARLLDGMNAEHGAPGGRRNNGQAAYRRARAIALDDDELATAAAENCPAGRRSIVSHGKGDEP